MPLNPDSISRLARGGKGKEVTVVKGKTLPPGPTKGTTYKLVDATKNKSGRGK